MKKLFSCVRIVRFLFCCHSLAGVPLICADDNSDLVREVLKIVQSAEAWKSDMKGITNALSVIERLNVTNAAPYLVPHISYATSDQFTMGNLYRVYPVVGCLRQLGDPGANAILDYAARPRAVASDDMLRWMRYVTVAVWGSGKSDAAVEARLQATDSSEAKKRLSSLMTK